MAARRGPSIWPWLAIGVAVVVLDQITKTLITRSFQLNELKTITPFFDLVRAHNTGAAFSFLAGASGWQRWFFIGLGGVATVFIVWLLARHSGQRLFCWALALILGGAVGNVVDFIQVHWASAYFPSFNVADSAISVGAALLILDELLRIRKAR